MKLYFSLFLLMSFASIYSQDNFIDTKNNVNSLNASLVNVGGWIPGKIEDKSIKGTSYLFPNWNGIYKVTAITGEKIQLLNLNYNIQTKSLESYVSADSIFQYDSDKFDYFYKANSKYKIIKNEKLGGLFQELFFSSKFALYKEPIITIKSAAFNPLTQAKMELDSYEHSFSYYLFINNNYEKIKLKKTELFKFFPKNKELIKGFVKSNNIVLTDEIDFIKTLSYLNTVEN